MKNKTIILILVGGGILILFISTILLLATHQRSFKVIDISARTDTVIFEFSHNDTVNMYIGNIAYDLDTRNIVTLNKLGNELELVDERHSKTELGKSKYTYNKIILNSEEKEIIKKSCDYIVNNYTREFYGIYRLEDFSEATDCTNIYIDINDKIYTTQSHTADVLPEDEELNDLFGVLNKYIAMYRTPKPNDTNFIYD